MNKSTISSETVMVASGGGRGITAACVKQLAKQYQCKFILLGRSAMTVDVPSGYVSGMDDVSLKKLILEEAVQKAEKITPKAVESACQQIQAAEEIQITIREIESNGGKAVYLTADVTERQALETALNSAAGQQFGPVTAIVHGAGNLADKMIERKTLEDFKHVFTPKISGLENLLSVIDPEKLSLMVLFSSVVGFYGNAGQSDYAMANDVLNKLGTYLQAKLPNCDVMVLDWGPWQSGMVTPALARAFERRGIQLIRIEDGIRFLANQVGQARMAHPQLIVGSEMKRQPVAWRKQPARATIKRSLCLGDNPFLLDHVIGGNPVLPATCSADWMIHSCLALYPGYSISRMENYRILKGIVFADELDQVFQVEINRHESSSNESLRLDVQLVSTNENRMPRYHYKCTVFLTPEIETPAMDEGDMQILNPAVDMPSGMELYQSGILFHGPSFQGVQQILELTDTGLRMRCKLPKVAAATQGQIPVRANNAFFNDVVVQSLLVWTQLKRDVPCLPASLEVYDAYQCLQFDTPYQVQMSVRSLTDTSIVGDIVVFDDSGTIYQRLTGLTGTISPQLKRLFAPPEKVIPGDAL